MSDPRATLPMAHSSQFPRAGRIKKAQRMDATQLTNRHGEHGLGDNPLYEKVWQFVIEYQGEQDRKGTDIPYTTHLRDAARFVLEDGGTPEEVSAAMLHDIVEDTPVGTGGTSIEIEDIREVFGDRVAEIVDFCTDAAPPPGEAKKPWRARKEAHFEHLRGADPGTLRVVVADKSDNIRKQIADFEACRGDEDAEVDSLARFKGGFAGTHWYYLNMCAVTGDVLATSSLYHRLLGLMEQFASLREPRAEEERCRVGVRAVLDRLDPNGVGHPAVRDGYYEIDAYELSRRAHAPDSTTVEEIVETHVTLWYGANAWEQTAVDEIARVLRS